MSATSQNVATSQREVAGFIAERPARYFAYHTAPRDLTRGTLITTWMGDALGRVLEVGEPYTSNFGDRRQSFRMLAVTMESYTGTAYLSAGTYVRVRKAGR